MLLGPALGLSAILFSLGVAGVLLRRNAIILFMCVELMLNAVNLTFVALAQLYGSSGQIMVFFVMTVAAAEAAARGVVGAIAAPLFQVYLVPFEITSILLLAAIVGAVVLAKRKA